MSMILGLATVSEATIRRLHECPPLVWRVIAPDEPELCEELLTPKPSFLGRLLGRQSPAPPELELGEGEGMETDLDKAWHGIHYLLTGTAYEGDPTQGFLLLGGEQVGEVDVGYGPTRTLSPAETGAALGALAELTDEEIASRFDAAAMTEKDIYPEIIWLRDPAEELLEYLGQYIELLREFLEQAVQRGLGVLIWMA